MGELGRAGKRNWKVESKCNILQKILQTDQDGFNKERAWWVVGVKGAGSRRFGPSQFLQDPDNETTCSTSHSG